MTEEEMAFRMPKVDIGAAIKVFPNGKPTEKPTLAFVVGHVDRSVSAKNFLNQVWGQLRHVSDPMLANRDDAFRKDCGAWDFSDDSKRTDALEKRVKTLEELLDKKTK